MPKSKHKGKVKHYLTSEEAAEQEQKRQRELEWKRKKGLPDDEEEKEGDSNSEDDEEKEDDVRGAQAKPRDMPPSDDSEGEDEEEEEVARKAKGVEDLIEVENPNRLPPKVQKAKNVDVEAKVELSRREREELEQQRKQAAYNKLHEKGLTDEARRDLARLAIIKQQREEAAKRRDVDKAGSTGAKR